MPFLEITMPKLDSIARQSLAERLNREFIDATGFEDEVLSIRFSEYGSAEAFEGKTEARFVNLMLYTPRLRHDIKRGVVAALTGVFAEIATPVIYISEFPYDNIGMGGQILTDADEELASRPFYYLLPR